MVTAARCQRARRWDREGAESARPLGHRARSFRPHGRPDRRPASARSRRGRRDDRDRRSACRCRAGRRSASRSACVRTSTSRSSRDASTSCTVSSQDCRASRTSPCAIPKRSVSPRSSRPSGSAIRRGARCERSCSLASTPFSRPPRRRPPRQPSAFPATTALCLPESIPSCSSPATKRKLVAIELHSGSLPVARAALRSLRDLPGWDAVLVRTKPLSTRPWNSARAARSGARPLRTPAAGPRGHPRRGCDRRARPDRLGTTATRGGGRRRSARRSSRRLRTARTRRCGGRPVRRGRRVARASWP